MVMHLSIHDAICAVMYASGSRQLSEIAAMIQQDPARCKQSLQVYRDDTDTQCVLATWKPEAEDESDVSASIDLLGGQRLSWPGSETGEALQSGIETGESLQPGGICGALSCRRVPRKGCAPVSSRAGAAVVMKVDTGEGLAMASHPTFDQSIFTSRISNTVWNELVNDEHKPLVNKCAAEHYPPGSTYKMVTMLAALELGISPRESVTCSGRTEGEG